METKKAFAAAVAKFPERERRTALAAFVARFSQPWPISNYRCHGRDAAVVEKFLKGCGMSSPADYQMVASAREPGSSIIRWTADGAVQALCSALAASLGDDRARLALYAAQTSGGDPAPGLRDESGPDPSTAWDPLGLVKATEAIAAGIVADGSTKGSAERDWAERYLGTAERRRPVTAPLWVLERRTAEGGLGLFRSVTRSSSGRTASVPFAVGRYVAPEENLVPAFPLLADIPVINVIGDLNLKDDGAMKGYLALSAGDLFDVPKDEGRGMWLHVEDAYVNLDDATASPERLEARTKALADPNVLWPYVESLYAKAYGCPVRRVPGQCMVHIGTEEDCGSSRRMALSAIDTEVADGKVADVRPCLLFLPADCDAADEKPYSDFSVRQFRWKGEPGGETPTCTRMKCRVDEREDAAAEWFLMTHDVLAGTPLSRVPSSVLPRRSQGCVSAERMRELADPAEVNVNSVPRGPTLDGKEGGGNWSAAKHVVYGIIEFARQWLDCPAYVDLPSIKWRGPDPKLHLAPYAVSAMYSRVRVAGDGGSPDDVFARTDISPADVTAALCALADPKLQLSAPAGYGPLRFDLVVETNIVANQAKLKDAQKGVVHDRLTNMFLHAFQNNERYGTSSWTNLCPGCGYRQHALMYAALVEEFGGRSVWAALWGKDERESCADTQAQYDEQNGDLNAASTNVRALVDSYGRLVLALRMSGAAAAVSRAAFRWSTGLPVATNETAEILTRLNSGLVVDPRLHGALAALAKEHMSKTGIRMQGWTSWCGPRFEGLRKYVPCRDDFVRQAESAGMVSLTPSGIAS